MKQIMDGCTAATHVAFAMSDVATIYPITPVAAMGEIAQKWGLAGRVNYAGRALKVEEMESELGAAGATHGALAAGALATTFTNSQGLLLMLPNMYKIAGNQLPGVFHVGARSLATHALSIFCDHQDVMAARSTGFAFLASNNVQETMDLAVVAHLAAIGGSLPVCHFFDGWRTSNEMSTIDVIPYDDIFGLMEPDRVARFRARALDPAHPEMRGTAQNSDVYFQNAEAANTLYDAFPAEVERQMQRLASVTGRHYSLFDYYGAPDAEVVLVAMGSSCEVIAETLDRLNSTGYRAGLIKVRLYRPFAVDRFLAALPKSVKTIVALDRTKDPGAGGEPLFKDIAAAVAASAFAGKVSVIGGRYGLASKDFSPAMVKAVIENAMSATPKRVFTVGITDDVTHLSLDTDSSFTLGRQHLLEAIFYGMGSDGTVGATRQAAHIIGDSAGLYAQAFFTYSAKKSGGYTVSQLRVDKAPIRSEYAIEQAGYIACNKDRYIELFPMLLNLRQGGTFVLNCHWDAAELEQRLPATVKRMLHRLGARFYTVDAGAIAARTGLGVRINTIMLTVFFKLSPVIPFDEAVGLLKKQVTETYTHEGQAVVQRNLAAIDQAVGAITPVQIPDAWADATEPVMPEYGADVPASAPEALRSFVRRIAGPCLARKGDTLPVSMFAPDGHMPPGTTAYEHRRIAINVPKWLPDKCVQCTECSFFCSHAAIRPFLLSPDEVSGAPTGFDTIPFKEGAGAPLRYRIQTYTDDCTGCGVCVAVCPGHALRMTPAPPERVAQAPMLEYCRSHVTPKTGGLPRFTLNGSQMHQPLLEFSGACGGCGETPYVKLLTQLFGERLIIANATGCSSVWGGNYPSNAYTTLPSGRGPAWGNSLFEDNAEYGLGMRLALDTLATGKKDADAQAGGDGNGKTTVWAIGGDGWAYDIGFAGLDHVVASGHDINILVLDTECYSNTGGQTSKATPLGAVTKYSPAGKRIFKKDLGRMMMAYGNVYVAQISLGASPQQAVDALREAEAYPGPSVVIAYCPCINHGIRAGMLAGPSQQRRFTAAGYWPLYRYNPLLTAQGLDPLIEDAVDTTHDFDGLPEGATPSGQEDIDSAAASLGPWNKVTDEDATLTFDAPADGPDGNLDAVLDGEDRYADLRMVAPGEYATIRGDMAARQGRVIDLLRRSPEAVPATAAQQKPSGNVTQ